MVNAVVIAWSMVIHSYDVSYASVGRTTCPDVIAVIWFGLSI